MVVSLGDSPLEETFVRRLNKANGIRACCLFKNPTRKDLKLKSAGLLDVYGETVMIK